MLRNYTAKTDFKIAAVNSTNNCGQENKLNKIRTTDTDSSHSYNNSLLPLKVHESFVHKDCELVNKHKPSAIPPVSLCAWAS